MDRSTLGKWEESYLRGENHIFFPKEEIVKFLSRHVRKMTSPGQCADVVALPADAKALDLGCGIGRQTILLREYGFQAFGLDISQHAIEKAQALAQSMGKSEGTHFSLLEGTKLPFDRHFFNVSICESVLDSMPYSTACELIQELDRVTNGHCFISIISGDDFNHHREFSGEEVVRSEFEQGTLQSYFNWSKVQDLVGRTSFRICSARLVTDESLQQRYRMGRYFLVLSNKNSEGLEKS